VERRNGRHGRSSSSSKRSCQRRGRGTSRCKSCRQCEQMKRPSSNQKRGRSISSSKSCGHRQQVKRNQRRGLSISSSKTYRHRRRSRSRRSASLRLQGSRFEQQSFGCGKLAGHDFAPAELQHAAGQAVDSECRSWKFERQPRNARLHQQSSGLGHHPGNATPHGMESVVGEKSKESTGNAMAANTLLPAHAKGHASGCSQADQTRPALGRTLLGFLFSTPFWQSNLLSSCGREGEPVVTERLVTDLKHDVTVALREYSGIGGVGKAASSADSPSSGEPQWNQDHSNDNFYQWQLSTQAVSLAADDQVVICADFLARSPAFMHLSSVIRESVILFLCDCYGLSMQQATLCMKHRILFAFAAAHGHNSSHAYHTHHHSIVSGVFYVNVPDGSGAMVAGMGLTIGDNQAMLPSEVSKNIKPSEYAVQPIAGNLLIFPSWMPHRVKQSYNVDSPRLSISFNISGEWSELSSLNSWTRVAPSAA